MKIVFLSDFFLSGQTTHVLELAKQLSRMDQKVHISFGQIHSRLFFTHYAPLLKSWGISFSQGNGRWSAYYFNPAKPDILHSLVHLFNKARRLASQLNLMFYHHVFGFSHPKYIKDLRCPLCYLWDREGEEILPITSQVVIIPNGIDTTHFVPPSSTNKPRRDILYVGRMDNRRFRSLSRLSQTLNDEFDLSLSVIADWDPQIRNTRFVPWQVDVVPYLQEFGLWPHQEEPPEKPSAVAMQFFDAKTYDGLISISCDKRGLRLSGNLGRYPFGRLKAILERLLSSPHSSKESPNLSRSYAVENLDSAVMAKQTLDVYHEILDSDYPFTSRSPNLSVDFQRANHK